MRHFLILIQLSAVLSPLMAQGPSLEKLAGIRARNIGPAGMSGRIAEIEVDPRDSDVLYVGGAAGGVWKSVNGGITWSPIFDDQPVASIGAIAIAPSNSDVIWVGTGEGNPRNSVSVGRGVFRSLDGGHTWKHVGLERTEKIHRILVDPRDPDVAYAAALGPTWSQSEQRGIFKTEDGGTSWNRVLYTNSSTGASDLVMDPRNPDKLIAALWEHRRWPWFFKSGGAGSGIFVTFDGGETWTQRTSADGIPAGELGRSGLAISDSQPNIVYATIESSKNALLRSEDGGFSFRVVNDSPGVNPRPFYYADIYVDPLNENRIYTLHSRLMRSDDGGKTFRSVVESSRIHGDHQALWINPSNPRHLIVGNDGGLAISRDQGLTWRFVENLPLAQFYHVHVDMETPYNVYGGLQDNGSWRGPSSVWKERGIFNWYWDRVGSGDGFDTMPDLSQPERFGYSMSQEGNLRRFDLETGERKIIRPVHPQGILLRFNWNAALAADPFDDRAIYFGSQFLHKSADRGDSWQIISPDLTTDNPEWQQQIDSGGLTYDATGAENFTTIVAIAPSRLDRDVVWVGTDDGNVQLTRDGGKTWNNVVSNVQGVPPNTWVPHIETSVHAKGTAFVVFEDHRRGNWEPYIFKTTDYGQTWDRLGESDLDGYALVIEEDPVEPRLLFAGTEFGLWVSFDAGASWSKWTHGVPTASVMDMVIHPRDHDLVLVTHGRAAFVLDDIRPLREVARRGPSILDAPLAIFEPSPAIQFVQGEAGGLRGPGDAVFQGANRPYGALITYIWNDPEGRDEKGSAKLEVMDGRGATIRTLTLEPRGGINRTAWGLERRGVPSPGFGGFGGGGRSSDEPGGFPARSGDYTLRLTMGSQSATTTLRIEPDPRRSVSPDDIDLMDAHVERVYGIMQSGIEVRQRLETMQKALAIAEKGQSEDLKAVRETVKSRLEELQLVFSGKRVQGIRRDPSTVQSQLSAAMFSLGSTWNRPTRDQTLLADQAELALRDFSKEVNDVITNDWRRFVREIQDSGASLVPDVRPVEQP